MAKPLDAKRRVSDHAVTQKKNESNLDGNDHRRRKTMGALPVNSTPSKHAPVNIPAGASAYYFRGTPSSHRSKTPAKSPLMPLEAMADTSMLSAGTSSSDESDMLNKSILSDTTELTASNFVLQASSRQLLSELAYSEAQKQTKNVAPRNDEVAMTNGTEKNDDKTADESNNRRESVGTLGNTASTAGFGGTAGSTPAIPSPSLRSRLGESPISLKKLSSSLRKDKQQNNQDVATHRSAARQSSGGGGVSFMLPPLSPATKQSEDPSVEIETDKPLGVLLSNLKEPTNKEADGTETVSSEVAHGVCLSPSSTIASTTSQVRLPGTPHASALSTLRQSTPHPKKDGAPPMDIHDQDMFASPTSTKADEASHFRLSSSPGSRKQLTPTRLSQSPRRVVNPESIDSPARNTRSAKKKASNSPAKSPDVTKMVIDSSNEQAGAKRTRDDTEEIGVASFSIRAGNTSRLSELTLSPSLNIINKRRRSSIAPIPPPAAPATTTASGDSESVHTSSTASTAELNNLFGPQGLGPDTRETVEVSKPAGMRSAQPSPATAEISIPRSILTSSRRSVPGSHQSGRKSVVFGSPEAAEYRIGSPSMSLTPMPRGTAKAMFSMPSAQGSHSSDSTISEGLNGSSMEQDETMEIENALMQNVATSQSTTTAAESQDMDTTSEVNASQETASTTSPLPPLGQPDQDETVELESNIEGLFSSAFGSPNDASNASILQSAEKNTTTDMETSPTESVDMTDAQSIASIASSQSGESESLKESSQKLNFENKQFGSSQDDERTVGTLDTARDDQRLLTIPLRDDEQQEEENTIELEADLTSLLASSDGAAAMTREAPKPVTLTKKFPKMDSSIVPRTNRLSFGIAPMETTEDANSGGDTMTDGSLTKELETNMESLIDSADDGRVEENGGDTMTDGSLTKELETNMESLVKATASGSDTPSASRRRSSHRFSLTPGRRTSISMDESIEEDSNTMQVETHEEANVTATVNEEPSPEDSDVLELDSKEVMESAGLPESPSDLDISDILSNADTNSENFRNPFIAEALAGFLFAVCGEVEMKAESSSDGNSCFNAIAEQNPIQLLQLQKALRSSDPLVAARGKEELQRLAQAAQAFVEFEWHNWEVQVVDSLVSAIDGIAGEFEENDERLMSSVTLADDALEAVSLMEGRAVQKARRQSMARRKVSVD